MKKAIIAVIVGAIVALGGVVAIVVETANQSTPESTPTNSNSGGGSYEDPLMNVAANTSLKSYTAITNDAKWQTDIVITVQSPGLYQMWNEKTVRFIIYDSSTHQMEQALYYGLETMQNLGNDEYKITIPWITVINMNGDSYSLNLAYAWTGYDMHNIDYTNSYSVATLNFHADLKVSSYLISQMSHGNNYYSILTFEDLNISNTGNCPFYYYLDKYSKGVYLKLQGKSIDMEYDYGAKAFDPATTSKLRFIVDPTYSIVFQGGDWSAQIVFRYKDSTDTLGVPFTIHVGP